jgi:hypothetical protein
MEALREVGLIKLIMGLLGALGLGWVVREGRVRGFGDVDRLIVAEGLN